MCEEGFVAVDSVRGRVGGRGDTAVGDGGGGAWRADLDGTTTTSQNLYRVMSRIKSKSL